MLNVRRRGWTLPGVSPSVCGSCCRSWSARSIPALVQNLRVNPAENAKERAVHLRATSRRRARRWASTSVALSPYSYQDALDRRGPRRQPGHDPQHPAVGPEVHDRHLREPAVDQGLLRVQRRRRRSLRAQRPEDAGADLGARTEPDGPARQRPLVGQPPPPVHARLRRGASPRPTRRRPTATPRSACRTCRRSASPKITQPRVYLRRRTSAATPIVNTKQKRTRRRRRRRPTTRVRAAWRCRASPARSRSLCASAN